MNIANCAGMMQGASDVCLEYTGKPVAGGTPIREHLSTAMPLGEMIGAISVASGVFLEFCRPFDHPAVYGSWITDSMAARARSSFSLIARMANGLIPRGMAGRAQREM